MNRGRTALTVILVAAAAAASARAQAPSTPSPQEPLLAFSIFAGMTSGGDLWTQHDQLQPAPGAFDTLDLARVLRPGLVAGLAATYYRGAHFAWTAEVSYFGVASEQRCQGPATFAPDSARNNINRQACTSANGRHVATSVVGFLVGATYRFAPQSFVQPFIRATVGPGLLGNSYIQTSGTVISPVCATPDFVCEVSIYDEPETEQLTFVANLSAGATFRLGPGYRLRFEVHDVVTELPVVTGPKPLTSSYPQQGHVIKSVPVFTIGLDVLLERRQSRRY